MIKTEHTVTPGLTISNQTLYIFINKMRAKFTCQYVPNNPDSSECQRRPEHGSDLRRKQNTFGLGY